MKKALSILLIAILLLSMQVFPSVQADEHEDLCQILVQCCKDNDTANIGQFGLDKDSLEATFLDLLHSGKLPWNIESYRYTTYGDGVILTFAPIYCDATVYDYAKYEQAVAEMLDAVILEGMSQWEMALVIHDYMIANCIYDETLERNTAYDLLVNRTTVCAGYAMAYMDIMTRLGIECRYVSSEPMNHAWNIVKIDGNWYHVDLTWDDPTPDCYGFVSHEHFLKTDKEMEALGYSDWDCDIACTDETFTDPIWKDIKSTIWLTETAWYMRLKDDWDYKILSHSADLTDTGNELYALPAQGLSLTGDGYYRYEHNGLSLWNGRLWFSDVDRVYSMLPDGTDVQTVFLYNTDENKKFIHSSYVSDGMIYLTLSDSEYNFTAQTVPLENTDYHIHTYTQTTLDSTCTEDGGILQVCQCGLSYKLETFPATGHTYESYISKQATCQEEGEKTFVCSVCDDTYTESFTNINAHSYETIVVKEPTFFKEGQKHLTCLLCGFSYYEAIGRISFQKHFGLTVWSTMTVVVLLAVMPILIISSSRKKKK